MTLPIKTILVGYRGFDDEHSLPALARALAHEHSAQVHLMHVAPELPEKTWPDASVSATEMQTALLEHRKRCLDALAQEWREAGLLVRTKVVTGRPDVELINEANAIDADLLIVTDEPGRRHGGRGFGKVTLKLLRHCPCPVLAERSTERSSHSHVMAAVDVSESPPDDLAHRIVELASSLAYDSSGDGIVIEVFHSWALWAERLLRSRAPAEEVDALVTACRDQASANLDELLSKHQRPGVELRKLMAKGDARHLIPLAVEKHDIDLVAMGTVSRSGVTGYVIGNTAERILNELTCSVLVVKPAPSTED